VIGVDMTKRGLALLMCVVAVVTAIYFGVSMLGIRHETLNWFDEARQRPVSVDLAVRRDYEFKANDGDRRLPVAIISNGNTVKSTEYSFLANVFAARGYLVASVQQDLPTDPPLMTTMGSPYVGRQGVYEKGEANILFVLKQLKKMQPNADYSHLTMVGHSNGGDTAMYFAKEHPELVSKVVTLDNLRVPFVLSDKLKILSFRSKDPEFKTDPGVLPTSQQAKADGIDIISTPFQHTWLSDRGPDSAKERIQATLDKFLKSGSASQLAPADTDNLIINSTGTPLL
jgi:dienelactone hydrolase